MAGSEASMSLSGAEEAQLRDDGENGTNLLSDERNPGKRKKRWTFLMKRKKEDDGDGNTKFKALTVSCRCKGAIKGSCLILSASFIELLGNLIALIYGVTYVLKAAEFFELDSDPTARDNEYDAQLGHVLFLEQNGVGFIGLLAICAIGMMVAFMMPIGTIYRSWKCIRASMSLLFAMGVFHIVLIITYLTDTNLTYSAAAIPFRMYELFLLHTYIQYYKKKKLEEIRSGKRKACGPPGTRMSQLSQEEDCIDANSSVLMDQQQLLGAKIEKKRSEVQVTFDIKEGNSVPMNSKVIPEGAIPADRVLVDAQPRKKKSRRSIFRGWQKQNAKGNNNKVQISNRPPERFGDYSK